MTTRDLTAGALGAIAAGTVRPILLYEGWFINQDTLAQEALRLWSGVGPLSWNGQTWTGAGKMLGISDVEESTDLRAIGYTVQLSGIALTDVERALSGGQKYLPGTVWLGFLNAAGAVIDAPYELMSGRFESCRLHDDAKGCVIGAQYESHLVDLERARERHYTTTDQQIDHATDRGFDDVPGLVNLDFRWAG